MSNKSEIAFTKDIATSVAEELGVPRDMVLDHIDFMTHWIKTISKNPEVLTIRLPDIGQLYVNISKVQKLYDTFSEMDESEMKTSWLNRLENHRLRLEAFNVEFQEHEGYQRHKKKSKLFNNWFNKGMNLQQLERWQNE